MSLTASKVSCAVRVARAVRPQVRCLATPSSSKPNFKETLDDGPSLDDFIADRVPDRVVLGNTKAYVLRLMPPPSSLPLSKQLPQSPASVIPEDEHSQGLFFRED